MTTAKQVPRRGNRGNVAPACGQAPAAGNARADLGSDCDEAGDPRAPARPNPPVLRVPFGGVVRWVEPARAGDWLVRASARLPRGGSQASRSVDRPCRESAVIAEPGKEELRITRTIADGETVEWEVDVTAELAARGSAKTALVSAMVGSAAMVVGSRW
jgi:hypothetical protein